MLSRKLHVGLQSSGNELINGEDAWSASQHSNSSCEVKPKKLQEIDIEAGGDDGVVDGDGDRSRNRQCSHPRQQSGDQQPAADHFRESRDIREKNGEGQMQGANKCISEVLDIGKLLVAVVNQQRTSEHPKHQQTEVARDGTRKNGANHRMTVNYTQLK